MHICKFQLLHCFFPQSLDNLLPFARVQQTCEPDLSLESVMLNRKIVKCSLTD